LLAATLAVVTCACGSRGAPLPPISKIPPPFPGAEIYQRGADLVLAFDELPGVVNVNGAMVALAEVEILKLAEAYPAFTADLLAAALDQERRTRLRDARQAASQVREELQRRRDVAAPEGEAAAADPEPQGETDEEEGRRTFTEDELALRSVPRTILAEWRAAGISPDAILYAAHSLQDAVDLLWRELEMPSAIVDLREPPELPDPGEIILAAGRVIRSTDYAFAANTFEFLRDAETLTTIPFDDVGTYRVGRRIEYPYPVAPPESGNVRTRYVFAARAISATGEEGQVGALLAAAPAAVAAAPSDLVSRITPSGIELSWQPPANDIGGAAVDPRELRYNIYRRELPAASVDSAPRNRDPLDETKFIDTDIDWDERFVYEVRAVFAAIRPDALLSGDSEAAPVDPDEPIRRARNESSSLTSPEIFAEDTFPPGSARDLTAVRTGNRVTLRWEESTAVDLAGYRVYRHQAPVPETPGVRLEAQFMQLPAADTEPLADDETATEQDTQDAPAAPTRRGQRRMANPLVEAGWELLTSVIIAQPRYIDPTSDPAAIWVYLVEAIDDSNNVSPPVAVGLESDQRP
jgi:hypothetical protein